MNCGTRYSCVLIAALAGAMLLASVVPGHAQSNVDPVNMHAWAENVGWTDWAHAAGGASAVSVGGRFLSGYIWAENVGWIHVGNGAPADGIRYANTTGADAGVNIAPDGTFSGLGWGENIGWVSFDGGAQASPAQPVYISCDGRLHGYAWSENVGWVNLSCGQAGQFVQVNTQSRPGSCDMNHDGVVDGRDVQAFVDLLLNGGAMWPDICTGDLGSPKNGVIDASDIAAFATCLLNG